MPQRPAVWPGPGKPGHAARPRGISLQPKAARPPAPTCAAVPAPRTVHPRPGQGQNKGGLRPTALPRVPRRHPAAATSAPLQYLA
jgi:hypothetical protein